MASTPLRRTFFFLVDGARVDVFEDLLRRGELPNVSRYLVEPGDAVLVDDPGYFNFHTVVRVQGGRLVPVPVTPVVG